MKLDKEILDFSKYSTKSKYYDDSKKLEKRKIELAMLRLKNLSG